MSSNNLNKNTNTNAILFEFVNGTLVSSEFQLIDLQRNQIKLVSETGDEYIIHSDYSIPDFCFDGEVLVIFMVLKDANLYPIAFPGKTENDVIYSSPIEEKLKSEFLKTPKIASLNQKLEQIKSEIQQNLKIIEDAIPVADSIIDKKPGSKYIIENKQKRRK